MRRGRLSRWTLLAGWGLLAVCGTPGPGQEPSAPLTEGAPAVIATSRSAPPTPPPGDLRLPPPDDGLLPPPAPTPPPVPPGTADEVLRRADHLAPPKAEKETPIAPTAAVLPEPSPSPAARGSTLTLDVLGPDTAAPGQELAFQIVVGNPGPWVLAGVRVELPVAAGIRLLGAEPEGERRDDRVVWQLGNLEEGTERRLALRLLPGQAGELHLRPVATFAAALGLRCRIQRPPFTVTLAAPETAAIGDKVALQIAIINNGSAPIRRIGLRCELPDGLAHPQGALIEAELPEELAPGQTRTIPLEAQAQRAGRFPVRLTATGEGQREARAEASVAVSEAVLVLSLDGPRQGALGQELTYRLEMTSPGSGGQAVRLTQWVPDGLEFAGASDGGTYSAADRAISWIVASPRQGQPRGVSYRVRVRKGGDWALHAAARGDRLADARLTRALHVEVQPALLLEVAAPDEPLPVGGEGTYAVRLYNQGQAAARDVALTVSLPEQVQLLAADGPMRWQAQGGKVRFEPLPGLRPRVDAVYRLRVRGLRGGEGRFRAEVESAGAGPPVRQELTSHVRAAPAAPAGR